ncbi:nuclear transport factor 2 family protein [Mycobacterium sp. pUA109]|uniref:nuclear transport factor 2 family protein n=1 Tax=Mycobacterium sp. pUA109 TaxID=3238982 RepID=UPI00351B0B99
MSATRNRELLTRYWNAFAAKDVQSAIACFTDDVSYEDLAIQQIHHGKDAVQAFWHLYFDAAGESFKALPESLVVDEQSYSFEWTVSGVIEGSFGIFNDSGQSFTIRGISTGVVRDGLIAHNRDYWNLADVLRQIGVSEIPPLP